MTAVASKLSAAIPALPARDRDFALSILRSLTTGRASDKQVAWAERLVSRANGTEPKTEVINVTGIVALLAGAGARLKFPKVRLATPNGQRVVLGIAGERSKYTGSVMITDGGPFGANTYFGRISPDGELAPAAAMTGEVLALLREFAADPAGVGALIGKRTGNCCFCSRTLETKESLAVGYGPVCAENYSLPWG